MFQRLKDRLFKIWEDRFMFGVGLSAGDLAFNRFTNGDLILVGHLGTVGSPSTGHWPWHLCEFGVSSGARASWHLGLLGFTVGKVVVNDYDQKSGEIVGPDKSKYYYFFKGINHRNKQLEEII
jgi:hypothetical protein